MEHTPQPITPQALLSVIRELQPMHSQLRVALDGPCATGKSTLAQWLSRQLDCPVLRMDDFFLTPDLRTQERLSRPGENVDHQRFFTQALQPLCQGQPARFRPGTVTPETSPRSAPWPPVPCSSPRGSIPSGPTCGTTTS